MSVIVAAFEPFDGRAKNRSERATRRMLEHELALLPVSFGRLPAAIDALLARDPELLLMVGESRTARGLILERFAVNLADACIPDNDGAQPRGLPIDANGAAAYAVRFPIDPIVAAIRAEDVAASASAHAGTFCCNAALYHALASTAVLARPIVAFIHLPSRRRHLRAGRARRGLRAAVAALLAEARAKPPNFI